MFAWSRKNLIKLSFTLTFIGIIFYHLPAYEDAVNEIQNNVPQNILMKDYQHVAIATDLEPDDVLALLIIFKEANKRYAETGKYPIDLVVVGEGNVDIKKMRMEALIHYMNLPNGIKVDVIKGKATRDNIFPLDGEELFDKNELNKLPFKEHSGEEGVKAISHFLADSNNPLIIQIKPAQELLSIPLS